MLHCNSTRGCGAREGLTEKQERDELEEVPGVVVLDEEEDRLLVAERIDRPATDGSCQALLNRKWPVARC